MHWAPLGTGGWGRGSAWGTRTPASALYTHLVLDHQPALVPFPLSVHLPGENTENKRKKEHVRIHTAGGGELETLQNIAHMLPNFCSSSADSVSHFLPAYGAAAANITKCKNDGATPSHKILRGVSKAFRRRWSSGMPAHAHAPPRQAPATSDPSPGQSHLSGSPGPAILHPLHVLLWPGGFTLSLGKCHPRGGMSPSHPLCPIQVTASHPFRRILPGHLFPVNVTPRAWACHRTCHVPCKVLLLGLLLI